MPRRERPVVLVAAGDTAVRRLVGTALAEGGFATADTSTDGVAEAVTDLHPDALLVEATLPATAIPPDLRAQIREEAVPLLMLGADRSPSSVVGALDGAGADDYLARPFDPLELAARLRSLIRRRGRRLASGTRDVGQARIDLGARRLTVRGERRMLSRVDWAVLLRLAASPGVPVPSDELVTTAFGSPYRDDRERLQASIARIRRALGVRRGEPGPIVAVRGFGYRFDPIEPAPEETGGAQGIADGEPPPDDGTASPPAG